MALIIEFHTFNDTNEKNKGLFVPTQSSKVKKLSKDDDLDVMTNKPENIVRIVPEEYVVIRPTVDIATTEVSVIQEHMLIAVETKDHLEAFAMATSSKGNTSTSQNTTTKLSPYKIDKSYTPESNTTAVVDSFGDVSNTRIFKENEYTKHAEGTAFVNQPEVKPIVDELYLQSQNNPKIPYIATGNTPQEDVDDFYTKKQITNEQDET